MIIGTIMAVFMLVVARHYNIIAAHIMKFSMFSFLYDIILLCYFFLNIIINILLPILNKDWTGLVNGHSRHPIIPGSPPTHMIPRAIPPDQ